MSQYRSKQEQILRWSVILFASRGRGQRYGFASWNFQRWLNKAEERNATNVSSYDE